MAYKMLSSSAFYMLHSLSAYVLTTIASVGGLWASVLNFQEFNEAI